jgi:phosphatidylglycerol:prolipoprotein diacylglycerol transferase
VPYFEQPHVRLGPITIYAFGVVVALSVWAGLVIGKRRFELQGLDAVLGERMAWWVIAVGFLGAHLFSVFFYFPGELRRNPTILLRFWENISSFGGMLGGFIGILIFFHFRMPALVPRLRLAYLDVAAFVFPVSLMIGRVACSLAHDHPGSITRFPLAISLERPEARAYISRVYENAGRLQELPSELELSGMGFHDLGWYEFLFLAAVVVPVTLGMSRSTRKPGFFLGLFALLYAPVRFGLDFLRVSDARYAGLTPAQFASAAMLIIAIATLQRWRGIPSTT